MLRPLGSSDFQFSTEQTSRKRPPGWASPFGGMEAGQGSEPEGRWSKPRGPRWASSRRHLADLRSTSRKCRGCSRVRWTTACLCPGNCGRRCTETLPVWRNKHNFNPAKLFRTVTNPSKCLLIVTSTFLRSDFLLGENLHFCSSTSHTFRVSRFFIF